MLIGPSAVMLLLLNRRIAGISGIVGRLAQGVGLTINLAFVLGLLLGPLAYLLVFDGCPTVEITAGWPLIIVAQSADRPTAHHRLRPVRLWLGHRRLLPRSGNRSLSIGLPQTVLFVIAMLVGMTFHDRVWSRRT